MAHGQATRRKPPRTIHIVATPGSGDGLALRTARDLRGALQARGHRTALEVFPDLERLHHWAATDRTPFSLLVCVGGDGTLDTAAPAAVRRSVPFLAIASGFGNLFGRALGQPHDVAGAVEILEHGELVHVDVGVRGRRLFLCHESYGFLRDIQSRVEDAGGRPRARWRRHLAYYKTALDTLRDAPVPRLRVAVDGRIVARDAVIVTVANVDTYGGWLPLTPEASPIDGQLDVFVMKRMSKRGILARLLRRQLRLPGADPRTLLCRGRSVSVSAARTVRDQLHVMPRRLPVFVSSATAEALARGLARNGGFGQAGHCQVA
jgi:diacylglycerol kinase family enzyme